MALKRDFVTSRIAREKGQTTGFVRVANNSSVNFSEANVTRSPYPPLRGLAVQGEKVLSLSSLFSKHSSYLSSLRLRARRINVRFLVRGLGRGKRISKDSVRLIARFYSRSEFDK